MAILAWLIGSKLGRYVALGGLIAAGLAILYFKIRASGAEAERLKMLQQSLENLRTRIKVDDEIRALPSDQRLTRLNRWLSE